MVKVKGGAGLRTLPSRQHSCSEMAKGHSTMLQVKHEHESPDELQRKIEDRPYFFDGCDTSFSKQTSSFWQPMCFSISKYNH